MAGEANFRKRVIAYLKDKDLFWFSVSNTAVRGVSDLHIICKGVYIACELKAEDGTPSALQMRFLQKVKQAGGEPWLLYPKDFPAFKERIEEILHDHN